MNITTFDSEGTVKGVFFRWPIQKVTKQDYVFSENEESCYYWREKAVKRIIPFLLNIRVWFKCKVWSEQDNLAGITVNELCSPIYFSRYQRTAFHKLYNHPVINSINVTGYEPYKNQCYGSAEKEKTVIDFKDGSSKIITRRGQFHYLYKHIIEQEFSNN